MKPGIFHGQRKCFHLLMIGVILTSVSVLSYGAPAFADAVYDIPEGWACSFPLHVESIGNWPLVFREFADKEGNTVRLLMAGKGNRLFFRNETTDATVSYKTGGSVTHVTLNSDGSQTMTLTGHNVMILFPTDVPGPSTTLYLGKVVFTVGADGVFTFEENSGRAIDICGKLSP